MSGTEFGPLEETSFIERCTRLGIGFGGSLNIIWWNFTDTLAKHPVGLDVVYSLGATVLSAAAGAIVGYSYTK